MFFSWEEFRPRCGPKSEFRPRCGPKSEFRPRCGAGSAGWRGSDAGQACGALGIEASTLSELPRDSYDSGVAPMPGRWCGRGGGFYARQVARPGGGFYAGQVARQGGRSFLGPYRNL